MKCLQYRYFCFFQPKLNKVITIDDADDTSVITISDKPDKRIITINEATTESADKAESLDKETDALAKPALLEEVKHKWLYLNTCNCTCLFCMHMCEGSCSSVMLFLKEICKLSIKPKLQ